ncbi:MULTISPECIES: hypothetical protein [unclassified Maridesulfovibrio]|uniref:hypothetical protein n=1 Tax=unclassified Maridesulfovibrio TaxID=2794999 RepID=UPI003B3F9DBA
MTVVSSGSTITFAGDGVQNSFDFNFRIYRAEDLCAVLRNSEGTEERLILGNDFKILSGLGSDSGGRVQYPINGTPLPAGQSITLYREIAYTQELELVDNDPFSAQLLNEAFDRGVMRDQQLQEQVDRALKYDISTPDAERITPQEMVQTISNARDEAVSAHSGAIEAEENARGMLGDALAAQTGSEAARDRALLAQSAAEEARDSAIEISLGDLSSLRSSSPVLSAPVEAPEGTTVSIVITDHSDDGISSYEINTFGFGSASITGGTISWVLETSAVDVTKAIEVTRRRRGELYSDPAVHQLLIKHVFVQDGPTIAFADSIDGYPGASVDSEGVHAPAYSVPAENASQIASAKPEIVVVNGKLIVLDGTTESVLKLAMLVAAGDVLITDQGEVFVASVETTSQVGSTILPQMTANTQDGFTIVASSEQSGFPAYYLTDPDLTKTFATSSSNSLPAVITFSSPEAKQLTQLSMSASNQGGHVSYSPKAFSMRARLGSGGWVSLGSFTANYTTDGQNLTFDLPRGTYDQWEIIVSSLMGAQTQCIIGYIGLLDGSISCSATCVHPLPGVPTKAFHTPLKTKLNWNISGSTASVLKLKENYIGKIFTNVGESEIVSNSGEVSPPESLLPRYMTQAANGVTITTTNAGNCQTVYCITDDGDNLSYCFPKSTSPTVTITFAEAKQIDRFSVWLKECGLGVINGGHELVNARDITIMGRLNSGAWQTLYDVADYDWYAAATIDEDALVPGLYNEIQITMGDNAHATYTYVISPRFQFYTAGVEIDGVLAEALPGIPSWVYKPSDFALKVGAGVIGEYIGPQEALKLDGGIVQLHEDIATFPNGSATRTLVDLSRKIPNGVTVSKFLWNSGNSAGGGYNQTIKMKIVKQTAANTFDVVVDQTIDCAGREGNVYYSDDLVTPYTIPETGDYYVAIYVQGTTPYFSFWSMTAGENANLEAADMTGTGNTTTSSAYVFAIGWEELGSSSTASIVTKGGSSVKDKILKAGGLHKTLLFDGVEKEVSAVSEVVSQGGPEIIADQGTFIHSTTTPGYEDINPLVNPVDTNLYWGGNDVGPAAVDTVYVGSQFAEDTTVHGFYLRQAGNATTGANSMTSVMVQESTDGIKWTDVEQITITEFGLNLGQYTLTTPRTGKFMRLLAKSNTLCAACGWAISYLRWFGLADVCITTILPTVELPQVPSSVAIPDRCTLTPANYAYALDGEDLKITGAEIVLEDNPELKRLAMAVSGEGGTFKGGKIYIKEKP